MHSHSYLHGGISISYEASTTIVMKKIKHRRRNEKRKDSIKKILGVLYTTSHSKSYRIMMMAAIKKWKCHIRIERIKNIFKQ
jgi:hypothetical protein